LRRPLASGPSLVTPDRVGSPPQVSHAAPAAVAPDDADDDELLELDEEADADDDELVDAEAESELFLSLLHAATRPSTHSKTRSRSMTMDRRGRTDRVRLITT
jgi:hypothetical protein